MNVPPSPLGQATPSELKDRNEAERRGTPFLVFRDETAGQRIVSLVPTLEELTIGRDPASGVCLSWDDQVSRLHARLEQIGQQWTVVDDGLSTNGSFVNGERLHGRHRLVDGDLLRFGATAVLFRAPGRGLAGATRVASEDAELRVSDAQRRVLVALCRPYKDSPSFATPATNQQIADELVLSLDAVKSHMRALFGRFGLEDLPQNEKRVRLVERALQSGIVSEHEL